jgi:hypothetical protein
MDQLAAVNKPLFILAAQNHTFQPAVSISAFCFPDHGLEVIEAEGAGADLMDKRKTEPSKEAIPATG